jgi:hypothetical protein
MDKQLLAVVVLVGCFGFGEIALAASSPLRIEIQTAQQTVKMGAPFPVVTKIKNISEDAVTLQIWICSYGQNWIIDNSFMHISPIPCGKNYLESVRLKPGEVYTRELPVSTDASSNNSGDTIAFRLGFMDGGPNNGLPRPVWSNPITLKIA